MYVIIAGTPMDGFSVYGPFVNTQAAMEWGSSAGGLAKDWWVSLVDDSETEEEVTLTLNGKRYYEPSNWTEPQIRDLHIRLGKVMDDLNDANEKISGLSAVNYNLQRVAEDLNNQISDADSQIHRLKDENVQ